MRFLAAPALATCIALTTFTSSAEAGCRRCECVDSKLRTICTSPTEIGQCHGACMGDTCIGYCKAYTPIAEQNRLNYE
jgi:hypothetical protein